MNSHFSDRQLLDVEFKLRSSANAGAIAAHLAECAACRRRAETLKQKISSLDLLRGNVSASEPLIAETLRRVRNEPATERGLFPRVAWLTGLAMAAGIVMAVVYTTHVITQPTGLHQMDKVQEEEPVLQIAMQKDEMKSARRSKSFEAATPAPEAVDLTAAPSSAEVGICDDHAVFIEHAEGTGIAASKLIVAKGFMARSASDRGVEQLKLQYDSEKAKLVEWSAAAPMGVTVQYYPALIEADQATRELKKDAGKQAEQWVMRIINPLDHAITASMDRVFCDTNWRVRVSDPAILVTTREPRIVHLTVEVPPATTKVFYCTTILPVKPAQGDDP
jgi:hypothetical protein